MLRLDSADARPDPEAMRASSDRATSDMPSRVGKPAGGRFERIASGVIPGGVMHEGAIPGAAGASQAELARLVEGDIIPRLLMTCRSHGAAGLAMAAGGVAVGTRDVNMLASAAIREDVNLLMAQIDAQIARGVSVETMLVDALAPAARLLGEWWEQDACDFIDVTMGLWRLQEAVHELMGRHHHSAPMSDNRRLGLFAVVPGDDHGFGSLVVEEMFCRAGWASEGRRKSGLDELRALVSGRHFDLLALTASTDRHAEALPALIAALRGASRNPDLVVMVGGFLFNQDPALAGQMGADASAPDAQSAVALADRLLQGRSLHAAVATGAG